MSGLRTFNACLKSVETEQLSAPVPSMRALSQLHRAAVRLEVASGNLSSCLCGDRADQLDRATEDHRFARDEFRAELERTAGISVALIARMLTL